MAENRHDMVPRPLRSIRLLVTLVLGMFLAPVVSEAQPRRHMPRVGVLSPDFPHARRRSLGLSRRFRRGLRDLGYVEGHTILIVPLCRAEPEGFLPLAASWSDWRQVIWTHSSGWRSVA